MSVTRKVAAWLRSCAAWVDELGLPPFTPLTDEQKQEVWDMCVDVANAMSTRDIVELQTEDWTERSWYEEYHYMKAAEEGDDDPYESNPYC